MNQPYALGELGRTRRAKHHTHQHTHNVYYLPLHGKKKDKSKKKKKRKKKGAHEMGGHKRKNVRSHPHGMPFEMDRVRHLPGHVNRVPPGNVTSLVRSPGNIISVGDHSYYPQALAMSNLAAGIQH